jgi:hypothetical protein
MGGVFPGVQGATVLHCLARLYEMAIQGATQGATKCYAGCYIFPSFKESGFEPPVDYSPALISREPRAHRAVKLFPRLEQKDDSGSIKHLYTRRYD